MFGGADIALVAAGEPDAGGLDVFAGAEAVDAEIGTGAGNGAFLQVADFHLIDHAAW